VPRAAADPLETRVAVVASSDIDNNGPTEDGRVALEIGSHRHLPDSVELVTTLRAAVLDHPMILPPAEADASRIGTL
jgi:hypothetical protein